MKWRIYYDDGTTRNHTEGLPDTDSLKLGVQVVVQQRGPDHFVTLHGGEYYLFIDETEWVACYQNGLEDWAVFSLERVGCVIRGRAIVRKNFATIMERARSDAAKNTLD